MNSRSRTCWDRLHSNAYKKFSLTPPEMQEHSKNCEVYRVLEKHFPHIPFVTVNQSCNGLHFAAPSLEELFLSALKVKAGLKAHDLERDVCLV